MENLDILIFTVVLVLLFLGFAIGTYLEFKKMDVTEYSHNEKTVVAKGILGFLNKIFPD